jgi:Protein of unknown function (DUF992)
MRYRELAGLIVLCLATAALAQEARTNIGTLTCTLGGAEGVERSMSCGFRPTGSGAEGDYTGSIRGRQAAPVGKRVVVWTVIGPADTKLTPAVLAQRFAGGSGESPILIGEENSSIVLQSETSNGTEAGDAITRIELRLSDPPA